MMQNQLSTAEKDWRLLPKSRNLQQSHITIGEANNRRVRGF